MSTHPGSVGRGLKAQEVARRGTRSQQRGRHPDVARLQDRSEPRRSSFNLLCVEHEGLARHEIDVHLFT